MFNWRAFGWGFVEINMELIKTEELEIKKSRFISYAFEVTAQDEVNEILENLKKEHKKARHICYAFILNNPHLEKCSDDGEPSGTAGRPILNVMQKKNVSNTLVCVVRYFGGIKLGAGGLLRAYTKSASLAL